MADLEPAPYFADVAQGPECGRAYWVEASDGVRLRLGHWPLPGARGTVLMFPGRTEYIEKYARLAHDMHASGYAMASFDWRGQGIADRARSPRDLGHITDFAEYQLDVDAFVDALELLEGVPRPWHLLAHSMGGAIGLRALMRGHEFDRVLFSAPMWGIGMSSIERMSAQVLRRFSGPFGLDGRFVPSTGPAKPGVFAANRLTTDRAQFEYMENQVARHPELAIGGPSIRWLSAALVETADLMSTPPPARPVRTLLGTAEKIVSISAIKRYMAGWPEGDLKLLPGAEHEVLMERPELRDIAISQTLSWFNAR